MPALFYKVGRFMEKWFEIRKGGDYKQIGDHYGISPELARLIINREVSQEDIPAFLEPSLDRLYAPELLKGAVETADMIITALREGTRIRIVGDYDIDGVFSAYILDRCFRECQIRLLQRENRELIDVILPHRIKDGYGLNMDIIRQADRDGVGLLVTCDNGISAIAEIREAKNLGMRVIVTDHHEVLFHEEEGEKVYELPAADVIVNPKQPDCPYPFKLLCGGAVAYKLSLLLYKRAGFDWGADRLLEYAAFATIGDVMELKGENRIIAALGLKMLEDTDNQGLRLLMERCKIKKPVRCFDVGFILGPCINAAGRLESAMEALELLQARDMLQAAQIAKRLTELNDERKKLTEEGFMKAQEQLSKKPELPKVLVVYLPQIHESIAGIIAGRLREKYERPSIVLSSCQIGLKGSGRSIEAYDMHKALVKRRELFYKFGGHPMAAGLSILAADDEERRKKARLLERLLNEDALLTEEDFVKRVRFDMQLPFGRINAGLIRDIERLEPCGTGNPPALFGAAGISFCNGRVMGQKKNCYKAMAADERGSLIEAVAFGNGEEIAGELGENERNIILFTPEINEYNGRSLLQIKINGHKRMP